MPAVITHDFFAQDAFGAAQAVHAMPTRDERDAFLLGSQGPDPLFYLPPVSAMKEFSQLATTLHHETPSAHLVELRRAADGLPEDQRPIGYAYLAGYVCHWLLDSMVHPFVYFWERGLCQAGVEGLDLSDHASVHFEVECDLDEMVLYTKRKTTVRTYRPYQETLRIKNKALETIGLLYLDSFVGPLCDYEPSMKEIFPLAVRMYRLTLFALWSPTGVKREVVSALETRFHMQARYPYTRALSNRVREEETSDFDNREHLPWRNPFTGELETRSFWDLYNDALDKVTDVVTVVLADDFDEAKARALTGGRNFSGEVVE